MRSLHPPSRPWSASLKRWLRQYCAPRRSDSAHASPRGSEQRPDYYDERARSDPRWSEHYTQSRYYPLWTILADRIRRHGALRVIDIGCGTGQLAALLRDQGVPAYLGLDFSPVRIELARQACPGFRFELADVFETDLLDSADYDLVLCTEFLEHVERDLDVLARLRPGVRFLGTVPSFPGPAHVRHFDSAGEVANRYGPALAALDVRTHLANPNGRRYFLLDGVTR